MSTEGYGLLSHVVKEFQRVKEEQASFLAGGGAKDFAEYRHICGVIRGLTHAETLVKDLVQRMENFDE
jgi:hypothetical protein